MEQAIIKDAEGFLRDYLRENLPAQRLYHNFAHADEVASVADALIDENIVGREAVLLAALFHDSGYAVDGKPVGEGSLEVFNEFAATTDLSEEMKDSVRDLIGSLHSDQSPSSMYEAVLHDANMSYMGRKRFFDRSDLLRFEKEAFDGVKYSQHDWSAYLLDQLVSQKFYTAAGQDRFTGRLIKNIAKQRDLTNQAQTKTTRKKTGKDFGRGVDTLYRVTLRNHINLSRIADGKANMIISINTVVLSIVITAGAFGFSLEQFSVGDSLTYIIPVLMLMITALATIVIAVLSAIPKVVTDSFTLEDVKAHKVSILFFGNFLRLSKDEFVEHLRELKRDEEVLYDDLSRDLYNLGAVLQRKYKLLSVSYRVFIAGMILSFLAFVILYLT